MEAIQNGISNMRMDVYAFADLVLTQHAQLLEASMGGTNASIQNYNNLYYKLQTNMQEIQNAVYAAQHAGLNAQLQPLYDTVSALVMDCQTVASTPALDENAKNGIIAKYQQCNQFLEQLLAMAVPEPAQPKVPATPPPVPHSPPPAPHDPTNTYNQSQQYGQQQYDQGGYQAQSGGYGGASYTPSRPTSVYGAPPTNSPPPPTGAPVPVSHPPGDPRGSKSLVDLITSENEYVKNLSVLINGYLKPMRTWASNNKKVLQEAEVDQVTAPFEMILKLHSQMLARLGACRNADGERVSAVIKSLVASLKVYTSYVQVLDTATQLLAKGRKSGKSFMTFLDECKNKSGSATDIDTLLTIPQKRLSQYETLINMLISTTPPTHDEVAPFREAQEEAKKLAEQMRVSKEAAESRTKLMDIQRKLGSALPNGMNLVAPHRFFVREAAMLYKNAEGKNPNKTNSCTVYAFNDMIIVTKSSGTFNKEEKVAMVGLYVECKVETAGGESKPAFRLINPKRNQTITFLPGDEAAKNSWFQEIKKYIDEAKVTRASGRGAEGDAVAEKSFMTKLLVRLVAGRNIVPCVYDPPDLVVLMILGEASKKSSLKEKCRMDPQWDEKFLMMAKNPYEQTLQIEVRDKSSDEVLGVTQIPLGDLYDYVENLRWRPLQVNGQNRGELLVGLTMGPSFTNTAL